MTQKRRLRVAVTMACCRQYGVLPAGRHKPAVVVGQTVTAVPLTDTINMPFDEPSTS